MKRETLSEAIGGIDSRYLAEATAPAPVGASGPSERIRPMKKKRIITLALAAALLLSLGVVAYAVSSIHAQRQQELHDSLQADNTASYVEYEVPGENADGVVLLSTINDGDFQKVYLNISPLTEEELDRFGELELLWRIDGVKGRGICEAQVPDGLSLTNPEEIREALNKYCYDPETQTYTICCAVSNEYHLKELSGADAVLHVGLWQGDEEIKEFGSVKIPRTEKETRYFAFDNASYTDEKGHVLHIVGLELTPVSAVWKFSFADDEEIHADRDQSRLVEWAAPEEYVTIGAQIELESGERFSTGGSMTSTYADGTVNNSCHWGTAVDIHAVQRITLDGTVLWEAR